MIRRRAPGQLAPPALCLKALHAARAGSEMRGESRDRREKGKVGGEAKLEEE